LKLSLLLAVIWYFLFGPIFFFNGLIVAKWLVNECLIISQATKTQRIFVLSAEDMTAAFQKTKEVMIEINNFYKLYVYSRVFRYWWLQITFFFPLERI